VLASYAGVAAVLAPSYFDVQNLVSLVFAWSILLPAVIGMQILLLLGRFDLSTGATASLSAIVLGLVSSTMGLGAGLAAALLVGAAIGIANGVAVTQLRIQPLIATLAMMGIVRSLALEVSDGRVVTGLPAALSSWTDSDLLGLPLLAIVMTVAAGAAAFVLVDVIWGRRFYAVGDNPIAATQVGLSVPRYIQAGYLLAGIGAALAGIVQASRTLSASPLIFPDLALDAIAACLIGGSALSGGRGSIVGACLGLLVIVATRNLVVMLGIPVFWKDFAVGVLLIVALSLEHLLRPRGTGDTGLGEPA
jgi:ribose/xylose/arabinose/galactoside ABC-type transport system permease subunit